MRNTVCKACHHLIIEGEAHECPDEAYINKRNDMIAAAARLEEEAAFLFPGDIAKQERWMRGEEA